MNIRLLSFFIIGIFFFTPVRAQIGNVNIIDSGTASSGVSAMLPGDLDKDGFSDLIVSFTGSLGKLAFYTNDSGQGFLPMHIIDSVPFISV